MFSRAPRYEPEKISDVPGPGYYNPVLESEPEYKRGGFLDKANRFNSEKADEGAGPVASSSKDGTMKSKPAPVAPGISHLKHQIETLQGLNTRLEKERLQESRKYEEKISRLESTMKSLVRDNVSLQSEVSSQQKELRQASEREKALRMSLEKAEAHQKTSGEKGSKLATLQRKVDELEKVHRESKETYQIELHRLTSRLDLEKNLLSEHITEENQLRKKNREYEERIRELRKATLACEDEISTLQSKLRGTQQDNACLKEKRTEIERLTQKLESAEIQVNEQSSRIAKLEKQADEHDRHMTENSLLKDKLATLECQMESERAAVAATNAQEGKSLMTQLNHVKEVLREVSEQYGQLASNSVALSKFHHIQTENAALQFRITRLERKLAERAAQTQELAGFIRQVTDEKACLTRSILAAESDLCDVLANRDLRGPSIDPGCQDDSLEVIFLRLQLDAQEQELSTAKRCLEQSNTQTELCYFRLQLLMTYYYDTLIDFLATETRGENDLTAVKSNYDLLLTQFASVSTARQAAENELAELSVECKQLQRKGADMEHRMKLMTNEIETEFAALNGQLERERGVVTRLQGINQQAQMREEALQADIEGLSEALSNAGHYEEAYYALSKEVDSLVLRNALAEEEAENLSRFNAQILGHTNANQKIHYVDRIRGELADTKQRLLTSIQERDIVLDNNENLRIELDAYKSTTSQYESKPRMRVARMPLSFRNMNDSPDEAWAMDHIPPDEMTLEDLR